MALPWEDADGVGSTGASATARRSARDKGKGTGLADAPWREPGKIPAGGSTQTEPPVDEAVEKIKTTSR